MSIVTIIIPTYNSVSSIGKCLDSILGQQFGDWDAQVIDGLSQDGTIDIVNSYLEKDDRISIHAAKDKGIYDAMNKGLLAAKGEWVYFIGSDDFLFNDKVLADIFIHHPITDKKVVYGNVKIAGNTSWSNDGDIYDGKFDLNKLMQKNICHQSVFYRRDFLMAKAGFFNIEYKLCADWDFNLRCWALTNFYYCDVLVAVFNAGGASTAAHEDEAFSKDFINNISSYFNFSLFSPQWGNPNFSHYHRLAELQKKKNYPAYLWYRLRRRLGWL